MNRPAGKAGYPPTYWKYMLRAKRLLGLNTILCDSCMWNWRSACHRPERPNATWCPDYKAKGSGS